MDRFLALGEIPQRLGCLHPNVGICICIEKLLQVRHRWAEIRRITERRPQFAESERRHLSDHRIGVGHAP